MQDYLILQLNGPMQSWGLPTFEGIRPSAPFPGRSGLLGLLGACLGINAMTTVHCKGLLKLHGLLFVVTIITATNASK